MLNFISDYFKSGRSFYLSSKLIKKNAFFIGQNKKQTKKYFILNRDIFFPFESMFLSNEKSHNPHKNYLRIKNLFY